MSAPPAFGYARISVASDGVSLDAQRKAIEAHCQARGLHLLGVLVDEGVSGSTPFDRRPRGRELARQLRHPDAKGVHLVVAKLDRAFRSALDALTWLEEWQQHGIVPHVLDLPIDLASPMGRCVFAMLAIIAQLERDLTIERTLASNRERRAQGRPVGPPPFGYVTRGEGRGRVLVPDPVAQATIGRLLELRDAGFDLGHCRRTLEAEKRRGAKGALRWHIHSLQRLEERVRKDGAEVVRAAEALRAERAGL